MATATLIERNNATGYYKVRVTHTFSITYSVDMRVNTSGSSAWRGTLINSGSGKSINCSYDYDGYSFAATTVSGTWYFWVKGGGDYYLESSSSYSCSVPATSYTVSYNANGGTGAPSSQTKYGGTTLTLRTGTPTRANSSAGSYTVTYHSNYPGGTDPSPGSAARTTSYSFKNWNTKANGSGTSYNPGGSYTANEGATLYAQWNSSTSTASVTLPTPTRAGYEFLNWNTRADGTGTEYGAGASYTPSGNVDLYAIWKVLSILHPVSGGTERTITNIKAVENGTVRNIISCYSVKDGVVRQGVK